MSQLRASIRIPTGQRSRFLAQGVEAPPVVPASSQENVDTEPAPNPTKRRSFPKNDTTIIQIGLWPNPTSIRNPCSSTRHLLQEMGLLISLSIAKTATIADLSDAIQQRWGSILHGTSYSCFLPPNNKSTHDIMALLSEDYEVSGASKQPIFVQPRQTVNHGILSQPCILCTTGMGRFVYDVPSPSPGGSAEGDAVSNLDNNGEMNDIVEVNNAEDPVTPHLNFDELYANHVNHFSQLPVVIVGSQILRVILDDSPTPDAFWHSFRLQILGYSDASWTSLNFHRDVDLHTLLLWFTHSFSNKCVVDLKSQHRFEFQSEQAVGDSVYEEAWNYLSCRIQTEDFLGGTFCLLTGADGRKRFRLAEEGHQVVLFRQFIMFQLKSFINGGVGFLGLHPAVSGYLLDMPNWREQLADFRPTDVSDTEVYDMVENLLKPDAASYFSSSYSQDFLRCYGVQARATTTAAAIKEIAMTELIDSNLSQLDLVKVALQQMGIVEVVRKFSSEKQRLFPATVNPSMEAVREMFFFPSVGNRPQVYDSFRRVVSAQEIVFDVLNTIGDDPAMLRTVVLACTGTLDPRPASVSVQFSARPAGVFTATELPVNIQTCFKKVEFHHGYSRAQWTQWFLEAVRNLGYAEFNVMARANFRQLGVDMPEHVRRQEIMINRGPLEEEDEDPDLRVAFAQFEEL